MGYSPRQRLCDKVWAVLKHLVCACNNKNTMGKLLFVQKREKPPDYKGNSHGHHIEMELTVRLQKLTSCSVAASASESSFL